MYVTICVLVSDLNNNQLYLIKSRMFSNVLLEVVPAFLFTLGICSKPALPHSILLSEKGHLLPVKCSEGKVEGSEADSFMLWAG